MDGDDDDEDEDDNDGGGHGGCGGRGREAKEGVLESSGIIHNHNMATLFTYMHDTY